MAAKKEETRRITIPKISKNQEDWIGNVGGVDYLIKRGVEVEVPLAVAEVVAHQNEMLLKQYEFEERVTKRT